MASPHDSLFWQVFSDPRHAAGELRALLPDDVERLVRWDTLQRLPSAHKDVHHGDQHADLLFGVEIGSRPALLYLLLEHKSTRDPWTAFQLLRYVVRVLEQHRRENPEARRLPPIVAMVVHHSASGWRRGTELLDLFDLDGVTRPALAPFLPQLRFLLDDLSRLPSDVLERRTRTALAHLTLLCLQRIRAGRDLRTEIRELREAFHAALAAADTGEALHAVLSYVARIRDLPRDELQGIIRVELGPELENAMTSTYDRLIDEGREQGQLQGQIQGQIQGQAELLLKLLSKRFGAIPAESCERIRSATAADLERWALRVLDAETPGQVFAEDQER